MGDFEKFVAGEAAPCGNFQRRSGVEGADFDDGAGRLAFGKEEQVEEEFSTAGLSAVEMDVSSH